MNADTLVHNIRSKCNIPTKVGKDLISNTEEIHKIMIRSNSQILFWTA